MSGDRGIFGYGLERSLGVPGSLLHWPRFATETFMMDRVSEANPNLDPSGNETKGDQLKAEGKGKLTGGFNTEGLLAMRLHHRGWGEHSLPFTGVHDWEIRERDEDTDAALAFYADSFWAQIWRDQEEHPTIYVPMGVKCVTSSFTVDANKHLIVEHDCLYLRDRRMAKPAEVAADAAWLGEWEVRGHRPDPYGDEYNFKVVTPGALGAATIVWGKNSVYGTTEYLVVDDWMYAHNIDDSIVGLGGADIPPRRDPMQIRPIFAGVLTEDDEFKIDPVSGKPVPVYATRPNLAATELELELTIGAQTKTRGVDSFSISMGVPMEVEFTTGSKYGQRFRKPDNAVRWAEVTINQEFSDPDLEDALRMSTDIAAYAKFSGALIGATGQEEFAEFTVAHSEVTKAGATITAPGRMKEGPVLRARSVDGSTLVKEVYRNTIASLTA